VKQVNLVNNYQLYKLQVCSITAFPGNDVPFLRCRYYNLGFLYLTLGKMYIASKLSHRDAKVCQPLLEVADNLRDQGLHRGDIDYLEVLDVKFSICPALLPQNLHNG